MKTSRWLRVLPVIGATALAAGSIGCTARAGAYGHAGGAPVMFHEPPTLVYVGSEVWVVRDSAYPVYYYDGEYWAYRDDVWYRADSYDGTWTRIDVTVVPTQIAHRDHRTYVHYTGGTAATTRPAPRGPQMTPASDVDTPPRARPQHPHGAPPGQMREPPGQLRTPPGHMRTPPGHMRTPPGHAQPPPGQVRQERATPPGRAMPKAPAQPPQQARPAPGRPDHRAAPPRKSAPPEARDKPKRKGPPEHATPPKSEPKGPPVKAQPSPGRGGNNDDRGKPSGKDKRGKNK